MEYEHERFDRLQASLLNNDPATTAFYNAQLRTERRVCVYMYMYINSTVGGLSFPIETQMKPYLGG